MDDFRNPARTRLANDELSLGVGLWQARTVDIAKAMTAAGFDWLFIDLEHNSMSIDTAAQISVAALDAGIAPLVRVPNGQYAMATRLLDAGAGGIVMPQVQNAAEAREIVDELRYAPIGHRGVTGSMSQFNFIVPDIGKATEILNRENLLVVMLETEDAIAQVDDIASVAGIDVVMIGTNDLAMDMGIPGQFADDRIVAAYKTVKAACDKNGKWMGMGGVYNPKLLQRYVTLGARFILSGNDIGFLMAGAQARTGELRGLDLD
ncbi:MAG: aldolase/citrate lyase family protein [Proteobacteria bacterium]|nr:aldolase/citrate lyase family protein [Pseudomonadota bacterium]